MLLLVDAFGAPWYSLFLDALKTALRDHHPNAVLDIESLWDTAAGPPGFAAPLPGWLRQKYAGRHYDIVVPLRPELVDSAIELRDELWPRATLLVPIVNASLQQRLRDVRATAGLTPPDSQRETLALVFRLLPQTRQVAVIGSALADDPLRGDWRRGLAAMEGRARLIDLGDVPFAQLHERVASLPPATVIYFAAPGAPSGRVASPRDLFAVLLTSANAPVFVDAATFMGTGAVGGAVVSPERLARDVAGQIDALLAGIPPERIGFVPQSPARTTLDWSALQRWRIPTDRIPDDSEVLARPPGLWTAYRSQVITGGAIVVVQAGLIAALLAERRRRRLAEQQTQRHLADLARLNRGAALGALSAALAHEISQPLSAILSNAETAELLMDDPDGVPAETLRELLAAIREDDLRAAAVLTRLRSWISNTPGTLRPVALNALVDEVAKMLALELRLRQTELQLVLAPGLPEVVGDGVQLQQVLLNLLLNSLEALQSVETLPRRIIVATSPLSPSEVEVSVRDNGPGLGDALPEKLFEPFFSTKPQGLGVGLAISRSIVERHRGRLDATTDSAGACFRFTLPVAAIAATLVSPA